MPKVVSGVLDKFADHAIDVPVPAQPRPPRRAERLLDGRLPRDWKPERVEAAWAKLWPDAGKRAARRLRLADAFDEKTAADSERALVDTHRRRRARRRRCAARRRWCWRSASRRAAAALVPLLGDGNVTRARQGVRGARRRARARRRRTHSTRRGSDEALPVRQAAALALFALGDPRAEALLVRLGVASRSRRISCSRTWRSARARAARRRSAARARELETVARLTPYFAEALVQLAKVAARLGDADAARAWLDDARYFGARVAEGDHNASE